MRKRTSAFLLVLVAVGFLLSYPVHMAHASKASHTHKDSDKSGNTESVVTLSELVDLLRSRNPAIQGARLSAEAKRTRILPERTLPDPTVSFQTMGDFIPPTLQEGDPSSGRTFSVEQEIPFPGKLGLKGAMATSEAEAEESNFDQTQREAVADLKAAYYDLFLVHKSLEILEKNKRLLQSFAQVSESKYRVGEGNQQDLLKAQVEISKILDRVTVLEQRRTVGEARINALLYRQAGEPLGKPEEVRKSELPYGLEQLEDLAQQNFSKLRAQEKTVERNQYAVQLAKKEYYPDFALGLSYVDRDDMREMYGFMAKAKVPLYFWRKQQPALEGAKLELTSAQKQRDSIRSTLSYSVRDAYMTATTSDKLIELYTTAVVPQARLSLEAALASYQVGRVDFLTVVDSTLTLLEYELKQYEALTDYQKALAQLEPLVGVELTR